MNTELSTSDLEALLPSGREPRRHREARLVKLEQTRNSSSEQSSAFDRLLLERYTDLLAKNAQLTDRFEEVRAIQAELRKQLEKITAPPWFPADFLRMTQTPAGPLAEVFHGGARRLVHVDEEVSVENLLAGQVVYLSHERNAVLGIGPLDRPDVGETASVERSLPDGRLLLRDRDEPVLVHASPALDVDALKPGDTVRWSRELMLALEAVRGSAPSEVFVTEYLSAKTPRQLGGLASAIEQGVSLFTQTIARPEEARRYGLTHGNTLLLHGPPGNGKTSLARIVGSALAAATGQQCRFASVKGAQLESAYVGSSQRNVRELFAELSKDERPALLFIDEVEAIGRIRGSTSGHHSDKFLSTWLAEIDGLERRGPVGIIASTNRKDMVDQALLERLSGMELFVGRPSLGTAREIFNIHLPPTLPYGPNGAQAANTRDEIVDTAVGTLYSPNADNSIAQLRFRDGSSRTVRAREILSGRTLEQICIHARRNAFQRHTQGGTPGVRVADMEEAVSHALARLASTMSAANAHALLSDLPQDLDVVAVEPVQRKVVVHHYLHRAAQI